MFGFKSSSSHLQISLNIAKLCKDEKYTIMMMYIGNLIVVVGCNIFK